MFYSPHLSALLWRFTPIIGNRFSGIAHLVLIAQISKPAPRLCDYTSLKRPAVLLIPHARRRAFPHLGSTIKPVAVRADPVHPYNQFFNQIMKFPSSYRLNSLTGSRPEFNPIRHAFAPRPAHAVRLDPNAVHPVSRRKPCPSGLNSPAGFSTKPANPISRHADGYSYRSHAKNF